MCGDSVSGQPVAGIGAGGEKRASADGRRYLSTKEAAEYLGLSPTTLIELRMNGRGPRYSKSLRRVIYDVRDIDEWVESGKRRFTGEAADTEAADT